MNICNVCKYKLVQEQINKRMKDRSTENSKNCRAFCLVCLKV